MFGILFSLLQFLFTDLRGGDERAPLHPLTHSQRPSTTDPTGMKLGAKCNPGTDLRGWNPLMPEAITAAALGAASVGSQCQEPESGIEPRHANV